MILSDYTILWMLDRPDEFIDPIRITPTPTRERQQIQPASVDLRLGSTFKKYKHELNAHQRVLHVHDFDADQEMVSYSDDALKINPGEFVLGTTLERVYTPCNILGKVDGRSSLGRMGLLVHITAGLLDPGFDGEITLEFYNVSRHPIVIPVGTRICQVSFQRMDRAAVRPYGHPDLKSKYQHQVGVTASRVKKDGEQ
jgi:dCTP deaminase